MAEGAQLRKPRRTIRSRRDWGRTFARLFCLIFAVIGAIPLTGGLLLRSEPLKEWAASETSRLLRAQLGVQASFSVELSLVPLRLAVKNLRIPATDSEEPAVASRLVAVSPRFFSLLAGRIDVGDIEVEDTKVRLIVSDGEIKNVAYRFSDTGSGQRPALVRSPFRSLAVTNVTLDLLLDGTRVRTKGIDIDAISEKDLSFDVALQTAGATISSRRVLAGADPGEPGGKPDNDVADAKVSFDEDQLCALDLRVFVSKDEYIIRRLSLLGALDDEPRRETLASCTSGDSQQVALRLSQLKVIPREEGLPDVRGHVMARAPLGLIDRLGVGLSGRGWAGFAGDISMDSTTKLPEISGQLTGGGMWLDEYSLSEELKANVLVSGDVIQIPTLSAEWGNGKAQLTGVKLSPFQEGLPLEIKHITTKNVDFPGVMHAIGVTEHSWVDWNFGNTEVSKIRGTLAPFYIDGAVNADTRDYVVWDRGFDDPARIRMIGIEKARVVGRFRAHAEALEFYGSTLSFGQSQLPIDLVSIGFFESPLIVRLKEGGGTIDLADVSPIANLSLSGKSELFVELEGPMDHPILEGTLSVEDLILGGFTAGNITETSVRFEPLFVDFIDLKGKKGAMDYHLPSARLNFDGPASVEFETGVTSSAFDLREFLDVFDFDEDPRFAGLKARGSLTGQVRYLLGGPEDTCGEGRLTVDGNVELTNATLLDEKYNGGNSEFYLEWFDIEAGLRGMRVHVPSLSLRKGSGSIFGSMNVAPGGILSGDIIATRVPISRVNAFGDALSQSDGFITGAGHLGGTLERLAFTAGIDVTDLKSGSVSLPASQLSISLTPPDDGPSTSGEVSGCGRPLPALFHESASSADKSEGTFQLNGQLFGGQIELSDLKMSRQRSAKISGAARIRELNLGSLASFTPAAALGASLPGGTISGDLNVEEFFPDRPFDSSVTFAMNQAHFEVDDLRLDLADQRAEIRLGDDRITTEHLAFDATTGAGQTGTLDGSVDVTSDGLIDASLDLRPTTLGVLAAALPGVDRAQGKLSESLGLTGRVLDPQISGFMEVHEGELLLNDFPEPITNLNLTVALDRNGLNVERGNASWGGGDLTLRGSAPLNQGKLGRIDLLLAARDVTLPLEQEIEVGLDADLKLGIPPLSDEPGELPALSGRINLIRGAYEKTMSITADISRLAARGEKTEVAGYDATKDKLKLDVVLTSTQALEVKNDLVEATLAIDPSGLRVSGTNQQFGAVGTVEIEKGGRVFLRRHEFEVQGGLVRFNDPTRLRPEVDVTAVTEYRRNDERRDGGASGEAAEASSGAPGAGNWRILMHAYGPPENLKVDLTSNPPLAQDDIFLLLAVGLTRTELDQTSSSGVGSSVALEALGSLSGAESAVTNTVPVDEFRFGSTYSARAGRTEPTVTIGKRLSDRIRASVTTSLSESSEVRSNVEYRATENLSVQGSYDNAGNVASATGGNLGGDVRWRLEFK